MAYHYRTHDPTRRWRYRCKGCFNLFAERSMWERHRKQEQSSDGQSKCAKYEDCELEIRRKATLKPGPRTKVVDLHRQAKGPASASAKPAASKPASAAAPPKPVKAAQPPHVPVKPPTKPPDSLPAPTTFDLFFSNVISMPMTDLTPVKAGPPLIAATPAPSSKPPSTSNLDLPTKTAAEELSSEKVQTPSTSASLPSKSAPPPLSAAASDTAPKASSPPPLTSTAINPPRTMPVEASTANNSTPVPRSMSAAASSPADQKTSGPALPPAQATSNAATQPTSTSNPAASTSAPAPVKPPTVVPTPTPIAPKPPPQALSAIRPAPPPVAPQSKPKTKAHPSAASGSNIPIEAKQQYFRRTPFNATPLLASTLVNQLSSILAQQYDRENSLLMLEEGLSGQDKANGNPSNRIDINKSLMKTVQKAGLTPREVAALATTLASVAAARNHNLRESFPERRLDEVAELPLKGGTCAHFSITSSPVNIGTVRSSGVDTSAEEEDEVLVACTITYIRSSASGCSIQLAPLYPAARIPTHLLLSTPPCPPPNLPTEPPPARITWAPRPLGSLQLRLSLRQR